MEDLEELTKDCLPCKILLEACKRLGDQSYCVLLLKQFKAGEIDAVQLAGKLTAKFGKKIKKEGYKVQKELGLIEEIPKKYREEDGRGKKA